MSDSLYTILSWYHLVVEVYHEKFFIFVTRDSENMTHSMVSKQPELIQKDCTIIAHTTYSVF